MAKGPVHPYSPGLLAAIEKLLGIDPRTVRRVVIDIKGGEFPVVYTELFGNETGLLNVVEALASVEIERK